MTSATIFPDTTILIQYQSLDRIDWNAVLGVKQARLMLSSSIWNEMEDIAQQNISPSLARRAQTALSYLQQLIEAQDRDSKDFGVTRLDDPDLDYSAEELDPNSVSDVLVASIIAYQQIHALEFVVLFTDDSETRRKARKAGIEIGQLPNAYLLSASQAQKPVIKPIAAHPAAPPKTLTPEHLAQAGPLFRAAAPPKAPVEPDIDPKPANAAPSESPVSDVPATADAPQQAAPKADVSPQPAAQPENREALRAKPPIVIHSTSPAKKEATPSELDVSKNGDTSNKTPASKNPDSPETASPETAPAAPPPQKPEPASADSNGKEGYKPPFLEMRQEPGRPDPGYVELFNLPSKKNAPPAPNGNGKNPLNLPPVALEPNGLQPDAVKPESTSSFSFSNQPPPLPAPPVNPFEPLIPSEASQPAKTDLRLTFENDENRTAVIIHHPSYPTIEDISHKLSHLRKNYPKLTQVIGANSGDGIGNDFASVAAPHEMLHQRRAQRIKRYNNTLDTFYKRSEKFMSELADFENLRKRSAKLSLSLFNDIPDSLRSLYIAIHFPSNVRVYSEDNLPEAPQGPKPPDDPDLDALFDTIRLPVVPIPSELSNSDNVKMRSRNVAPMEVRWNKGWDVIYSVKEIGKHERIQFNPLFIVFNSFDHATAFRIHYRITVASASYEELGELEVLVRKEL